MTLAFSEIKAESEAAHAAPATLADPAQKSGLLRFITCGSVDDGKSTLIGRLLYDSNSVPDDQIETLSKDSRRFGTQGENLDFALLVDGLSAEREQGITIDVAYRYFSTPKRAFIVADTPGHEQYTRNMATGASTADLAIILIDARKGVLPQTRRHSFIVSMLGVRHVAVAVNKMDLVGHDQTSFERICSVYRNMAEGLGFEEIVFFPISARDGDNVARLSSATPWYRGRALLDFLETARIVSTNESQAEFVFPVQLVNRPDSNFRGYAGTVACGVVRAGAQIMVLPRGLRSTIARIVAPGGDLDAAIEGQSVTLTLSDEIDISRGDVIVLADSPRSAVRETKARLLWMGDAPFSPDETYVIKIGTATAQARVSIEHTIDIHTFASSPARSLRMNEIASASLSFDRALVALPYAQSRELGGFILIDKRNNETVALGRIEETEETPSAARAAPQRRTSLRFAERLMFGATSSTRGRLEQSATAAALFILSAVLFFTLSRSAPLSLAFALLETLARPLIRQGVRTISGAYVGKISEELNNDGAGI